MRCWVYPEDVGMKMPCQTIDLTLVCAPLSYLSLDIHCMFPPPVDGSGECSSAHNAQTQYNCSQR